ncbi:MAG: CPBP family intramembrane metalloprotease [Armatimonadetes bacterium]|nr:CPBP family intramembrane metalloprotease [Armatimonadota bacterium]
MVGKYLVVVVVGFLSTFFNMISMTLTFSSSLMGYAKLLEQAHVEIRLSLSSGLWILLLMIPLTALFAGLTLAVASFARSFREASNYLGPLSLVAITPGFVVFLPGFEISWNLAWVPVVNVVLLLKQIMLGEFAWPLIVTVFLSNALYGLLALRVVCAVFEGEEILLASGEEASPWSNLLAGLKGAGRVSYASRLSLSGALLIFFVCLALLLYVGPSVQRKSLLSGILVVEFGLILFPCILLLRSWGISLKEALCLSAPRPIHITGAIGIGMTMWVMALLAFWIQSQFFPVGSYFEDLERALGAQRLEHPAALLIIASVAPGICEEVLFRGVLQPVFIRRWGFWQGILLSAFLFGAFHMMLPKLIPAMVLGLFLGYLAARTGSLYVSMTAHATNNFLALLFSTTDFAKTGKLLGEHGEFLIWWVPVVAVLILVVSLQAFRRSRGNQLA